MWYELRYNRAVSALYLTVFLVIMLLESGGIAIVFTEAEVVDTNIRSASDVIWWACVIITKVGYGDRAPLTNTGRIIGLLMMTAGLAYSLVIWRTHSRLPLSPEKGNEAESRLTQEGRPRSRDSWKARTK